VPNFAYVAKARTGEETAGFQNGASVDAVIGTLHERGLVVLHISEDRTQASSGRMTGGLLRLGLKRVGVRDLALFTRQFATIIESGIPIVRGIRGIASDFSHGVLRRGLDDVADRIERGERISDALSAHPEAFNGMYVSMVRAGERAGTMDRILEQLAVYQEKVEAIRTKVRSAMSYPIFVLAFALLSTVFLLYRIVPTFTNIYAEYGQKLPKLTVIVMTVSNAIRDHVVLIGSAAVSVAILLILFGRTRSGRRAFDALALRAPIFGPIVQKTVMSRFSRTLGILLQTGLPILEALELVKGAVGNAVVAGSIDDVKMRIASGQGMTQSFRATRRFPELVLQMMATGEESGQVDALLLKTSDFYDRQVEAAVHSLTSLIEPIMIVLVGAMIGVIVVSMFLPIFNFGNMILQGGANYQIP
jgi:type IV pilus assembly protein PilC